MRLAVTAPAKSIGVRLSRRWGQSGCTALARDSGKLSTAELNPPAHGISCPRGRRELVVPQRDRGDGTRAKAAVAPVFERAVDQENQRRRYDDTEKQQERRLEEIP
jgi:hypothetical protein